MARFDRGDTLLNAGRFLHSVSYGADALFAGVGQCGYAPRDLFHATGAQHSRLGPSWPWYERVPWLRSPHAFKRSHSLCARQLSRHGEDEGCRQGTGSSRISSSNYAAETAGWAFWGILSFLMKTARSCRESSPGPRPCRHRRGSLCTHLDPGQSAPAFTLGFENGVAIAIGIVHSYSSEKFYSAEFCAHTSPVWERV